MIASFRELSVTNKTAFEKKLDMDIASAKDGIVLYAFLPMDTNEFSSYSSHNYYKLKVLKDTDNNDFLGFLVIYNNTDRDDKSMKILPKTIFDTLRGRTIDSNIIGYCFDKIEAEAVKLISIKNTIDKFCNQFGYDSVQEFNSTFTDFKMHHAEKFV